MDPAITELAVVQICFFRTFASQFGNTGYGFTFFFGILYLLLHDLGNVCMFMQVIVQFLFDEVAYELVYRDSSGRHIGRSQFDLRLTFKHRLFHVNGNGSYQSVADIGIIHTLVIELFDRAGYMFFEGALMSSSLGCMLSVDKGVVLFTILSGVRKGDFDIFSFEVNDRIKSYRSHIVIQQVYQSIA